MKHMPLVLIIVMFSAALNAQWSPFAPGATNGMVIDFEVFNSELYAGGFFSQINGNSCNRLAKWNGASWQNVGNGFSDGVHQISVIHDTLFVARYKTLADSNWIFYWNNNVWNKLGSGFFLTGANANLFYTASLYDVLDYEGHIVASGEFSRQGQQDMLGVAEWNGSAWQALGTGLSLPFNGSNIYPHQLLVHDGYLYVCGNFTMADNTMVNGIAVWDGLTWSAMGNGFNNVVYGLGVYNNEIYAGGEFTASGQDSLKRIAKWNGNQWVSPGFGFDLVAGNGANCFIHTIKEINGLLYLSGGFNRVVYYNAPSEVAGNIVHFNGTAVNTMNQGVNNDVEAIVEWDNKVLVGGFFSQAGGVPASKLAYYDPNFVVVEQPSMGEGALVIAPNPALGSIRVSCPGMGAEFWVEIVNAYGQVVCRAQDSPDVDVSALPVGLYWVKVGKGGQCRMGKFLKCGP